ncbi:RidA family protein [Exilibacterium tricleocarpae]|uniref:RidA family protein n=1 Tax=Exilibacterium tricleocarpae TaxID=2591008 RepID=A0A545TVA0_9GAMM|nr:RidA family protein [Exilibacterium tricleocarpae]TQV81140.1 RidA family protein [Exilibacterium tricleocarpae]
MRITRGNPKELFNSTQYGFSQAVSSEGTRIVSISGQVAWDAGQTLIGAGDLYAETSKSLENLKIALESVQARLEHVISLRIYIVDYKLEESESISRALKAFFPEGREPTATWIGVNCLANPDFRIEIEAMAIVPEG